MLFIPLLLLVLLGSPGNGQAVVYLSSGESTSLDITYNSTSGTFDTTPGETRNTLTVSGKTGDTNELTLVQPNNPADPNSPITQSKVRFDLGTVKITYTLAATHKIPLRAGTFQSESTALMDENADNIRGIMQERLEQSGISQPSRRRSVERRWASDATIDGDLVRKFLESTAKLYEDGTARKKRRAGTENPTIDRLMKLLGVDPEGNDNDMVYIEEEGQFVWKRRSQVSLHQLLTARTVVDASHAISTQKPKKTKREIIDVNTGIASTAAANSMNTDLFDDVGGACTSLKYGGGSVGGVTEGCLINSVDYLNGRIDAVEGNVNLLNAQMAVATEAIGQLGNTVDIMIGVQKEMGSQINAIQDQTDLLREEARTQNFRINDLTQTVNVGAYTDKLLAMNDLVTEAAITRQNYVTEQNLINMDSRFVGASQLNDEATRAVQNQMRYLEEQLDASMAQITIKIYTDMATVSASSSQNSRKLQLDTNLRLDLLANDISFQFTEINQLLATVVDDVRKSKQVIRDQNKAITNLYNQFFSVGTAFVDYFVYKWSIYEQTNGTFIPIVIEGTGVPPPNMSRYTAWGGADLTFEHADPTECQLDSTDQAEITSEVNQVLVDHAVLDVLMPLSIHPSYLHYSGDVNQFAANAVVSGQLVRYLVRAAVENPADSSVSSFLILTASNPSSTTFVPLWVPDTPTNRVLGSRVSCFFVLASGNYTFEDRTVREADSLQLGCYVGLNTFLMSVNITAHNIRLVQGSPPAGDTLMIKSNCTVLSDCKNGVLIKTPFEQTNLVHLLPPGGPYLNSIPREVIQLIISSSSVSVPPFAGSSYNVAGLSFLQDFTPRPNATNLSQTFLNQGEVNTTISDANEANSGTVIVRRRDLGSSEDKKERRRRAVSYPAASMGTCYTGLNIDAGSTKLKYNDFDSTGKTMVRTCSQKPGCMLVTFQEPTVIQTFDTPTFTGTTQRYGINFNTGDGVFNGAQDYAAKGARSIIIPPSVHALSYKYPLVPLNQRCAVWKIFCKEYLQVDECTLRSTAEGRDDAYCASKYGSNIQVNPWTMITTDYSQWDTLLKAEWNGPGQMCAGNANAKFTAFCVSKMSGTLTQTSAPTTQQKNDFCVPNTLRNNLCSQYGGAWKPCFSNIKELNTAAYREGTPDYPIDNACDMCAVGYGKQTSSGTSGIPDSSGNCPPKATDLYIFGNTTNHYTFTSVNNTFIPAITKKATTTTRQWHACVPDDGSKVNVASSTEGTVWEEIEFPYFITPGDIPSGGVGYRPGTFSRIISLYPNCRTLSETNCFSSGVRLGLCEITIDPNATTPGIVASSVTPACNFIVDDVCRPKGTNIDACLNTTVVNSNNVTVPLCLFDTKMNGCQPLNRTIIGTTLLYLPSPVPDIYVNCSYRDPSVPSRCTFDWRCYHYATKPIPGVASTSECRPTFNMRAILDTPTTLTITTSATAIGNLTVMGFSSDKIAECFGPRAVCSTNSDKATLRLQLLLSLANNLTTSTPSSCADMAPEPDGGCENKRLVYDPSWPFGWSTSLHQSNTALSLCVRESSECRDNCLIYRKDLNKCLQKDYCMIQRSTLECKQANLATIAVVCPNQPSSTNDIGSECVKSSNLCTILKADTILGGANFTVVANTTEEDNNANLENSECAKIAGVVSGNLAAASNSTRFTGVNLPLAITRTCIAVADETGLICKPAALVGACQNENICNGINDPTKRMAALANGVICGFENIADCVLYTLDGNYFPCSWTTSSGSLGYCTLSSEAERQSSFGASLKIYTAASYSREKFQVAARFQATAAQLVALTINLNDIDPTGAGNPLTSILMLGPPKIVCPFPGFRVQGYGCCIGDACTNWRPNPWDPKYAYYLGVQARCSRDIPKVTTIYSTACISKQNNFTVNPDGSRDSLYICEPFVNDDGLRLFKPVSPSEVPDVEIPFKTTAKIMTPLKKAKTVGTSALDLYPDWRQFAVHRTFTYINTIYALDNLYSVNVTSFDGKTSIFDPWNATASINRSPSGLFVYNYLTSNSLQTPIDIDIELFATAQKNLEGPFPQAWRTRPDHGVKVTSVHPGTTKTGKRMAKATRSTVVFVEKNTFVKVWKIVGMTDTTTASMTLEDGTKIAPDSIQVTNNFASSLPNLGESFVFVDNSTLDPLHIYGAGDRLIGQPGEPYTLSYIYQEVGAGNFDPVAFMKANPRYDPDLFSIALSQFISDRVTGARPGSPASMCGKNVVNSLEGTTDEVKLLILKLNLAYDTLSFSNQAYWDVILANRTITELENLFTIFKQAWVDVGCTIELVNYIEPSATEDLFQFLITESVFLNTTTNAFQVDQTKLRTVLSPLAEAKNRVQCGNCIILVDSEGNPVTSRPNTAVCNPLFGNKYPEPPPKVASIDLLKFNLPFCNRASYYNITFNPEQKTLELVLNLGLGDVRASFRTNRTTTIFESTATTVCAVVSGALTNTIAGIYELRFINPYPFTVTFFVRVRQNATALNTTLDFGDGCNKDDLLSVPPNTNATVSTTVCSNQPHFVQVYNQIGRPCSQAFEGNVDYTDTFINQTVVFTIKESSYQTTIEDVNRNLAKSISDLEHQTDIKLNETKITIAQSIVDFSAGPLQAILFNSSQAIVSQLNNQTSAVQNLAGLQIVQGTSLISINDSVVNLRANVETINSNIEVVTDIVNQVQNSTVQSLTILGTNVTALAETVRDGTLANAERFDAIEASQAEFHQYLGTLQSLVNATGEGGTLTKQAEKGNQLIGILIGAIVGSGVMISLTIVLCWYFFTFKQAKAAKAALAKSMLAGNPLGVANNPAQLMQKAGQVQQLQGLAHMAEGMLQGTPQGAALGMLEGLATQALQQQPQQPQAMPQQFQPQLQPQQQFQQQQPQQFQPQPQPQYQYQQQQPQQPMMSTYQPQPQRPEMQQQLPPPPSPYMNNPAPGQTYSRAYQPRPQRKDGYALLDNMGYDHDLLEPPYPAH